METKEITITCTWQSTHVVEVPIDFTVPNTLGGFPEDVLEELTSHIAELIDWA